MLRQLLLWRCCRRSGVNASARHSITSLLMKRKPAGITPTTVYGAPSMRRSRPTAEASPPNCDCHSA